MLLGDGEEEDDPDNWRKSAEEDWNRDIRDTHNADGSSPNQGEASMDQDHFIRSLHELVDLWTVTTNAEEYLDFIDYTLTRVCEISPQTKFSFWTRAVQRLQLPRFLKLKLGPDGDDSQTPGNDGQLPESVAHILDSGSFSSSTLDELRFEFHRAAPDGMLDLDGFKRVLVRLGYKGMANDGGCLQHLKRVWSCAGWLTSCWLILWSYARQNRRRKRERVRSREEPAAARSESVQG